MKKLSAMILALVMLQTLSACTQKQETETEVRYLPLEVTHDFSDDYVRKYVYHYDENWVQTGITTYLNGELESETTYELDLENNQILKMINTAPDGATAEIEYKNSYDAKGNLILQEQYAEGVLVTTNEFTYDKDGNRLSQAITNHSSGYTSIITYDADGNMLRTESIMEAIGDRPASHAWVDYTYDENGNQIKTVNYHNDGESYRTTVTEYDSQGRKVKSTASDSYSGEEVLDEIREFTYEDNTETEKVYDADGNLQLTGTKTYDDDGNLLISETLAAGSDRPQRSTYIYQKIETPEK